MDKKLNIHSGYINKPVILRSIPFEFMLSWVREVENTWYKVCSNKARITTIDINFLGNHFSLPDLAAELRNQTDLTIIKSRLNSNIKPRMYIRRSIMYEKAAFSRNWRKEN